MLSGETVVGLLELESQQRQSRGHLSQFSCELFLLVAVARLPADCGKIACQTLATEIRGCVRWREIHLRLQSKRALSEMAC